MNIRIGIGLAPIDYSNESTMVGWDQYSIAYHSDDGKLFKSSGQGDQYGPKFKENDTIGVFMDIVNSNLFFTLNGTKLKDITYYYVETLTPCVSIKDQETSLSFNFGTRNFKFNHNIYIDTTRKQTFLSKFLSFNKYDSAINVNSNEISIGKTDECEKINAENNNLSNFEIEIKSIFKNVENDYESQLISDYLESNNYFETLSHYKKDKNDIKNNENFIKYKIDAQTKNCLNVNNQEKNMKVNRGLDNSKNIDLNEIDYEVNLNLNENNEILQNNDTSYCLNKINKDNINNNKYRHSMFKENTNRNNVIPISENYNLLSKKRKKSNIIKSSKIKMGLRSKLENIFSYILQTIMLRINIEEFIFSDNNNISIFSSSFHKHNLFSKCNSKDFQRKKNSDELKKYQNNLSNANTSKILTNVDFFINMFSKILKMTNSSNTNIQKPFILNNKIQTFIKSKFEECSANNDFFKNEYFNLSRTIKEYSDIFFDILKKEIIDIDIEDINKEIDKDECSMAILKSKINKNRKNLENSYISNNQNCINLYEK